MLIELRNRRFLLLLGLPAGLLIAAAATLLWPSPAPDWTEEQAVEHQQIGLELHAMAHVISDRESGATHDHVGIHPEVSDAQFAQQLDKWTESQAVLDASVDPGPTWGALIALGGLAIAALSSAAFAALSIPAD